MSANATTRSVVERGSGRKVRTGVNVTLRRVKEVLGAAECAATHIVHLADSAPLAWWWVAKPSADHKVSIRHNRATHFTLDRTLFTPLDVFSEIYTEPVIQGNRSGDLATPARLPKVCARR